MGGDGCLLEAQKKYTVQSAAQNSAVNRMASAQSFYECLTNLEFGGEPHVSVASMERRDL